MADVIINDSTINDALLVPKTHNRGLDLSSRPKGFAYGGTAEPFPDELLIPRSEWQARIAESEERRNRISDICTLANLACKDQQQTNYCWINAPTYCTEVVRVLQNQKPVVLSPASAGAQIKGYQNVGGWGKEGLEWISKNGLVPVDKWPANAIDRQYATADNKQLALDYRVSEWWEIEPQNLDQYVSCLLRRIPIAIGLAWWSHEVTAADPVWLDGTVAIRIRNSWGMSWNDRGYAVLQGSRMMPDDAVAPRTTVAS